MYLPRKPAPPVFYAPWTRSLGSRGYPSFASEDRGGFFGRLDRRRLGSCKALCGAWEGHRA